MTHQSERAHDERMSLEPAIQKRLADMRRLLRTLLCQPAQADERILQRLVAAERYGLVESLVVDRVAALLENVGKPLQQVWDALVKELRAQDASARERA